MGNKHKKAENPEATLSDKMFDNIFEFKQMAKGFTKEANKASSQEKQLLSKLKNAIAKGKYEEAKVIATDTIRKKNEVKKFNVWASKIDTISQKLQSAYNNQRLSESMKTLTEKMLGAGSTRDMVGIVETMSNFEKMFDDLDVNSEMMNQVFDNINVGTTNDMEVQSLINEVAEANGLKIAGEFNSEACSDLNAKEMEKVQNQQNNIGLR